MATVRRSEARRPRPKSVVGRRGRIRIAPLASPVAADGGQPTSLGQLTRAPCVDVREPRPEALAAHLGGARHLLEAVDLRAEDRHLSIGAPERVGDEQAPFRGVGRLVEGLPRASPGGFVLEQLRDLGEREAGVVAELLDEAQPLDVRDVVKTVGALASRRGAEEAELLVVADGARRQAELGRDLLDAQEALGDLVFGRRDQGRLAGLGCGRHPASLPQPCRSRKG